MTESKVKSLREAYEFISCSIGYAVMVVAEHRHIFADSDKFIDELYDDMCLSDVIDDMLTIALEFECRFPDEARRYNVKTYYIDQILKKYKKEVK